MRILFLTLIAVWMALPASTFELTLINEWDVEEGGELYPHFSADGSVIYMSNGLGIYKFDPETGEKLGEVPLESLEMIAPISHFQMSADRTVFMLTDLNSHIYFYDAINEKPLSSITDMGGGIVQRYAISGDGSFALISKYPGELLRWDINDGAYTMRDSTGDKMLGIGISADGSLAIRANSRKYRKGLDELYENRIIIFDPNTFEAIDTIENPTNIKIDASYSLSISNIEVSSENRYCGLIFNDKPVMLDLENSIELWSDVNKSNTAGIEFINDNKSVFIYRLEDYTINDIHTNQELVSDSLGLGQMTMTLDQKYLFARLSRRLFSIKPSSVAASRDGQITVDYLSGNLKIGHLNTPIIEQIDIVDIQGRSIKVFEQIPSVSSNTTELTIDLPEGVYICRIMIEGRYYSQKFIVKV